MGLPWFCLLDCSFFSKRLVPLIHILSVGYDRLGVLRRGSYGGVVEVTPIG